MNHQQELVLKHTFTIAVGPTARAEQRARTLGFADLAACLADLHGLADL